MTPNKRLGQHFLINQEILSVIAHEVDPKKDDLIIEIGPGHGELTAHLLQRCASLRLIAIEKDPSLAKLIAKRFPNCETRVGDATNLIPKLADELRSASRSYKIVGNIPYYITGHLFRILGKLSHKPVRTVFTIQKEVAERVTAKPGRLNILAATIQIWAKPKLILNILKNNFQPEPKVDSALLTLDVLTHRTSDTDNYFLLVKTLFQHPRKTVWNNLRGTNLEFLIDRLERYRISAKTRPQELTIDTLIKLSELL